jgi:hypothetical protein
VLVQEGKLAHTNFSPWRNDVIQNALFGLEGKPTHARFPSWWNDIVGNALMLGIKEN